MRVCALIVSILLVSCAPRPADPGTLVIVVVTPDAPVPIPGLEAVIVHVEKVEAVLRDVADDPSTEHIVDLGVEPGSVSLLGLSRWTPRKISASKTRNRATKKPANKTLPRSESAKRATDRLRKKEPSGQLTLVEKELFARANPMA